MSAHKHGVKNGRCRDTLKRLVRCIDCSAEANAGDLLAIVFSALIGLALCASIWLAIIGKTFISGFVASTIIWNWKRWLYDPMDKIIKRVYSPNS